MPADCSSLVRKIYYSGHDSHALTKEHIGKAVDTVSRFYPPDSAGQAFALLAALNLLNAAVKTPWGRKLVCYDYIKGMAGLLFEYLTVCPISGVETYNDRKEHVTYFRVAGVQLSFHFAHIARDLPPGEPVQEWDGIRLQLIPVEVFDLACSQLSADEERRRQQPGPVAFMPTGRLPRLFAMVLAGSQPKEQKHKETKSSAKKPENASARMHAKVSAKAPEGTPAKASARSRKRKRKKQRIQVGRKYRHLRCSIHHFYENKQRSLNVALKFNIWRSQEFTLLRRRDMQLVKVIRFNGCNYNYIVDMLIGSNCPIPRRAPEQLFAGLLYHISPRMRLRAVLPSEYIYLISHNNYLTGNGRQFYNLLVTYGIARYLSMRFPRLRFACSLITNRRSINNRLYNYAMLQRVPLHSRMRRLKVWLVCDPIGLLQHFRCEELPAWLVDDYMQAEDYYQEFEVVSRNGLKGIYAYRRHHLLKPIYADIVLFHCYAHVQRTDGLWAIYSLNRERFESNFVYTRVWYDHEHYIIYGEKDGQTIVIHDFFDPSSPDFF